MFPGIRDKIKIYSLPADCSDLFSAPDRGSFDVSNSCALWRFGPPREPSQLMCFLMPCVASKFHAMSFFLFRIYSESIPNPIQKPIPKLQKREKTQDILRFIHFGKKKNSFFNVASMIPRIEGAAGKASNLRDLRRKAISLKTYPSSCQQKKKTYFIEEKESSL